MLDRTAAKEHPPRYDIWAACCLEVEVDVLTGIYMVRNSTFSVQLKGKDVLVKEDLV